MSWDQLLNIIHDPNRGDESLACPECGEPLDDANGVKFCRFDGYQRGVSDA